jgi:hypothetical protein
MFVTDTEDTASFESLGRRLALESITNNSVGIIDVFSRLINKADNVISSFVAPLQDFTAPNKELVGLKDAKYLNSLKKLRGVPYTSYQHTLVMVPEGFTGNLIDYLRFLETSHGKIIQASQAVVNDYALELSIFMTNVDARKAIKTHEAFYKKVREDRAKIEKNLKAFFSPKDVRSRVPLGNVITRFGDLEEVFALTEKLQKSFLSKKELQALLNQVNHATELLRLLKEKLEAKELADVSGDMAKHISEGSYEVAKYIELTSLLTFNIEVAVTTVKSMADQFTSL